MSKKAFWSHLLTGAGAVLLLGLVIGQFFQLRALRDTVAQQSDRIEHLSGETAALRSSVLGVRGDIRQELASSASLFSHSDCALDYRDGALVLTVGVLPKEVRADEALYLSAEGVGPVLMTPDGSGLYQGSLALAAREEIIPIFSFQSAQGARQEALAPLWSDDVLALDIQGCLALDQDARDYPGQRTNQLYLIVSPASSQLGKDFLAGATLTAYVYDDSGSEPLGYHIAARSEDLAGQVDHSAAVFSADLGPYVGPVGAYRVCVTLTTAGGLTYSSETDIVSFRMEETGLGRFSEYTTSQSIDTLSPSWA